MKWRKSVEWNCSDIHEFDGRFLYHAACCMGGQFGKDKNKNGRQWYAFVGEIWHGECIIWGLGLNADPKPQIETSGEASQISEIGDGHTIHDPRCEFQYAGSRSRTELAGVVLRAWPRVITKWQRIHSSCRSEASTWPSQSKTVKVLLNMSQRATSSYVYSFHRWCASCPF